MMSPLYLRVLSVTWYLLLLTQLLCVDSQELRNCGPALYGGVTCDDERTGLPKGSGAYGSGGVDKPAPSGLSNKVLWVCDDKNFCVEDSISNSTMQRNYTYYALSAIEQQKSHMMALLGDSFGRNDLFEPKGNVRKQCLFGYALEVAVFSMGVAATSSGTVCRALADKGYITVVVKDGQTHDVCRGFEITGYAGGFMGIALSGASGFIKWRKRRSTFNPNRWVSNSRSYMSALEERIELQRLASRWPSDVEALGAAVSQIRNSMPSEGIRDHLGGNYGWTPVASSPLIPGVELYELSNGVIGEKSGVLMEWYIDAKNEGAADYVGKVMNASPYWNLRDDMQSMVTTWIPKDISAFCVCIDGGNDDLLASVSVFIGSQWSAVECDMSICKQRKQDSPWAFQTLRHRLVNC